MRNTLLAPLGLGVAVILGNGCANEPARDETELPGTTPSPDTAPAPMITGGQTGSGSAPPRMTCVPGDGGAARGVVVESTLPDATRSCESLIQAAYERLLPDLEALGSRCVPAASLDPRLVGGASVCQCQFDSEDPESDTGGRINATYAIGLEKARGLLGIDAGACEAAGPYQWTGSSTGYEECVIASDDFAGCSLEAAATSCESTCASLRERQAELAREVKGRYEHTLDQCHSQRDLTDCMGACVGAFRVGANCYRGVVTRDTPVFAAFEPVDCAAPAVDIVQPSAADAVQYMPFCTSDFGEASQSSLVTSESDAGGQSL